MTWELTLILEDRSSRKYHLSEKTPMGWLFAIGKILAEVPLDQVSELRIKREIVVDVIEMKDDTPK